MQPAPSQYVVAWLFGLSGAGKSTLAHSVAVALEAGGLTVEVLDSDHIRPKISADLGFSPEDRKEHLRRMDALAQQHLSAGKHVIVAAISPLQVSRDAARSHFSNFLEVFVDAPVEVCVQRDPLGLYGRFNRHEVRGLAGVDAPFDVPQHPDVHCYTATEDIATSTQRIVSAFLKLAAPTYTENDGSNR